jgi:hypothetical protein
MKILHLPDIVGGHAVALSRAERAAGHESLALGFRDSPYGYTPDIRLNWGNGPKWRRWIERSRAFLRYRGKYDIYHFNFGSSLLHAPARGLILPDICLYGRHAARMMTFQGSDARLAYPGELAQSFEAENRAGRPVGAGRQDRYPGDWLLWKRRAVIEQAARRCDFIYALNPDLLAPLPMDRSAFLPYAIEPPDVVAAPRQSRSLHIVHLSTNPLLKGTGLVEAALKQAQKHADITYDIVIRRPRPEALARMAAADILIDQVVLGWYGATAVEAMYLGIPVMARIAAEHLPRVPQELAGELPMARTSPATLAQDILGFVNDPERRALAGRNGKAFARKWHSPATVAGLTISKYAQLSGRPSE